MEREDEEEIWDGDARMETAASYRKLGLLEAGYTSGRACRRVVRADGRTHTYDMQRTRIHSPLQLPNRDQSRDSAHTTAVHGTGN